MARADKVKRQRSSRDPSDAPGPLTLSQSEIAALVTKHISDGIIIHDLEARIIWANERFYQITGYPISEVIGEKPHSFLLAPDMAMSPEEIEAIRYDPTAPDFSEIKVKHCQQKSGELFWASLSFGSYDTPDGTRVVVTVRNISTHIDVLEELRIAKLELEQAVNLDPLTGLANRRRLSTFLTESLAVANKTNSRVGLLNVDLDKFKDANDAHGHAAGDAILTHVASCLTAHASPDDLAARTGGDEFILVVPGGPSAADLIDLSKSLVTAISASFYWEGVQLNIGASIGISLSSKGQLNAEELIQNADFALYEVKDNGRGSVSFYDHGLRKKHLAQKGLAVDFTRAVSNDELEFQFQPIVDLASNKVVGVETLARWRHPDRGLISPCEFVAIAEDIGRLKDLDLAAMRAAVRALKVLTDDGFKDVYASFNASTHTVAANPLTEQIKWEMDAAEIQRHRLAVEVLETVFFAEDATETKVAQEIAHLNRAGFMTNLDDFGVGYAGLAHLGQLNLTGIKIDRSIVRKISDDESSAIITKAILQLANDLELRVVAEGVECSDVASRLMDYGCDVVQGFGIAEPMELQALRRWLAAGDLRTFHSNILLDQAQ